MFNPIKVEVSRRNLTLTPNPDGLEVKDQDGEFEVTVTNNSREFVSFQVALMTAGVDSEAIADWYQVEPEICAKKPPGASTTFRVSVVRSPLPVYDTTIDVLLRVFSIEQRSLTMTQKLTLTVKKPQQPLSLVLPNKEFKISPGDRVEIPVLVYNYSPKAISITLTCVGLPPVWLSHNEQKIRVEPSYPTKATFSCRLPDNPELLRQTIPFTIEAIPDIKGKGRIPTEKGTLEVTPAGIIEFRCAPKKQQISTRRSAAYQIEFKNASNCLQRIQLEVADDDRKAGSLLIPDTVTLEPGQSSQSLQLVARKKRHWCLRQSLQFDIKAAVLDAPDGRNTPIRAVPSHHSLELEVRPIVSPLIFLGGGIIALLLFWLNGIFNPAAKHTATVRSVRFDGTASNVFSGSSDRTIRQWQVIDPMLGQPQLSDQGQMGQDQQGVRVIRLKPDSNNEVAVGLENGTIQLWDVLKNKPLKTILQRNDRVFDLDFTRDSNYLFSGHGSSRVHQWNLNGDLKQSIRTMTTNFAITSLVASPTSSESFVVIAGQFNQLMLWNWQKSIVDLISYSPDTTRFKPLQGQQHYIESLAIANDILATADNQGYITLWNWRDRKCTPTANNSGIAEITVNARKLPIRDCNMRRVDRWTNKAGKPIRSVAITPEGDYLVSAGDDGQINLWSLTNGRRLQKRLTQFSGRVHSVDIKTKNGFILVASDAPGNQVKLYREPMKSNASQQ